MPDEVARGRDGGSDPEYRIWELEGVLVREEYKMPWVPLAAVPGFEGVPAPGIEAKYFGKDERGPFAYLIRMPPATLLAARRHRAGAMRYLIEGDCTLGGEIAGRGWFQYAPAGQPFGPVCAGPDGCLTIEIYDGEPGAAAAEPG